MIYTEPVQSPDEDDADFAARLLAFNEAVDAEIDRMREDGCDDGDDAS